MAAASALGLKSENLRWIETRDFGEVKDALSAATVAVLPRVSCAGFPIKLLNHMAVGLPTTPPSRQSMRCPLWSACRREMRRRWPKRSTPSYRARATWRRCGRLRERLSVSGTGGTLRSALSPIYTSRSRCCLIPALSPVSCGSGQRCSGGVTCGSSRVF